MIEMNPEKMTEEQIETKKTIETFLSDEELGVENLILFGFYAVGREGVAVDSDAMYNIIQEQLSLVGRDINRKEFDGYIKNLHKRGYLRDL